MEEPKGKAYEGPMGVGRDSVWLTQEDLDEGKDATVEIEGCVLYPEVTFQGGRKRTNLLGLKFVGKARVLGLNATNRKTIGRMFGNVVKNWKGQKVTLYVTETQMAGETVKCIRVRDRGARAATAAEQFLHDDRSGGGKNAAKGPIDLTAADTSANGHDTEREAFERAADQLDLSEGERDALIEKHAGNAIKAYEELAERVRVQA